MAAWNGSHGLMSGHGSAGEEPEILAAVEGGRTRGWTPRNESSRGPSMKVIVDLCVVPSGVGVNLAPSIALGPEPQGQGGQGAGAAGVTTAGTPRCAS
jgi:hypothetical protein